MKKIIAVTVSFQCRRVLFIKQPVLPCVQRTRGCVARNIIFRIFRAFSRVPSGFTATTRRCRQRNALMMRCACARAFVVVLILHTVC